MSFKASASKSGDILKLLVWVIGGKVSVNPCLAFNRNEAKRELTLPLIPLVIR